MQSLFQIQQDTGYSEIWKMLLISIGVLGVYISFIVLVSGKVKNHCRIYLGFYTFALSLLLFHLTSLVHPMKYLEGILSSAGLTSLFLIGPFSCFLFHSSNDNNRNYRIIIHFLPATFFLVLSIYSLDQISWIYIAGIAHTGIYFLVIWIISITANDSWIRTITTIQIILLVGISSTSIASAWRLSFFIASIGLVVLILSVWIRLIYTAYISYINHNNEITKNHNHEKCKSVCNRTHSKFIDDQL